MDLENFGMNAFRSIGQCSFIILVVGCTLGVIGFLEMEALHRGRVGGTAQAPGGGWGYERQLSE
jgi:hypothetical protein